MKIQFWAVGKEHEAYIANGVAEFTKRINNYFPSAWKIIGPPKNASSLPGEELKKKEAEAILKLLNDLDYLVCLDEHGKQLDSLQLASFLHQKTNESTRSIIFLIGGSFGLHQSVLNRANYTLSLSLLTFPHQLVRLIISEQVYRACTIMRNEKYHHS
jgi:23S rRNA (pseudouridine1915-N3)-methyltransferase